MQSCCCWFLLYGSEFGGSTRRFETALEFEGRCIRGRLFASRGPESAKMELSKPINRIFTCNSEYNNALILNRKKNACV